MESEPEIVVLHALRQGKMSRIVIVIIIITEALDLIKFISE
jgi:hypothetical protein